ncbi:MAG: peptidase U35 [Proteobacteria bacterium SG_bin6]|nr:MAG: peptidase U35 [Proteobacteria bacterium SG_bin6]
MSLRFAGYAALFDRPDRGGDMIRAGAFQPLPPRVPLLWDHAGPPIGTIETLAEDARGLRVIGALPDGPRADRLRAAPPGLSFGYRVKRAARQGTYRELLSLDLIEVSLVSAPMQPLARVYFIEEN